MLVCEVLALKAHAVYTGCFLQDGAVCLLQVLVQKLLRMAARVVDLRGDRLESTC